jgi:hypothetical protein
MMMISCGFSTRAFAALTLQSNEVTGQLVT